MQSTPLQEQLISALIGLARATENNSHMLTDETVFVTLEGLLAADSGDIDRIHAALQKADQEKQRLVPSCYICAAPCGRTGNYDLRKLQDAPEEIRSLKLQILGDLFRIATKHNADIADLLYLALFSIGMDDWGTEELLPIAGKVARAAAK